LGRKLGGWDEADVGAAGNDAPVGVRGRSAMHIDLICRTAVYVTRMHGGVGGGAARRLPIPNRRHSPGPDDCGRIKENAEALHMSTAKEELTRLIQKQPEDSSTEEIVRELAFHVMVERGLADSDARRVVSNEEMARRIRSWQK